MHRRARLAWAFALAIATAWSVAGKANDRTTGRVVGSVTLVAPPGAPLKSGAYAGRRVTRPSPHRDELRSVIVFVKDAPANPDAPARRMSISQQAEAFVPRVAAITRGSTVEFPNFDPFFHNVFSLSRGSSFDLGRYPKGETRTRTFTRPGLVKVYCHLHSDMSATIMVFDHALYTVPSADGTFELENIPAGQYRLSAWHERIGEQTMPIEVAPGGTARVSFALPVETR